MEKDNKPKSVIEKLQNCIKSIKNTHFTDKVKDFVEPPELEKHTSQLRKRVISSLIMIPFAVYAIFFSANLFLFFMIAATVLMVFEWCDMTQSVRGRTKWRLIGFLYITIPIFCLIKIRLIDADVLLWMFLVIWSSDICAYFTGKIIGGKKLAPSISPGKTWSGFFGALALATIVGLFTSFMFIGDMVFFIIISMIISIVSQISDLMESKFKRIFNVKDSGHIIPGHGGILDRLDGVMLTSPLVLLLMTFAGKQFGL